MASPARPLLIQASTAEYCTPAHLLLSWTSYSVVLSIMCSHHVHVHLRFTHPSLHISQACAPTHSHESNNASIHSLHSARAPARPACGPRTLPSSSRLSQDYARCVYSQTSFFFSFYNQPSQSATPRVVNKTLVPQSYHLLLGEYCGDDGEYCGEAGDAFAPAGV